MSTDIDRVLKATETVLQLKNALDKAFSELSFSEGLLARTEQSSAEFQSLRKSVAEQKESVELARGRFSKAKLDYELKYGIPFEDERRERKSLLPAALSGIDPPLKEGAAPRHKLPFQATKSHYHGLGLDVLAAAADQEVMKSQEVRTSSEDYLKPPRLVVAGYTKQFKEGVDPGFDPGFDIGFRLPGFRTQLIRSCSISSEHSDLPPILPWRPSSTLWPSESRPPPSPTLLLSTPWPPIDSKKDVAPPIRSKKAVAVEGDTSPKKRKVRKWNAVQQEVMLFLEKRRKTVHAIFEEQHAKRRSSDKDTNSVLVCPTATHGNYAVPAKFKHEYNLPPGIQGTPKRAGKQNFNILFHNIMLSGKKLHLDGALVNYEDPRDCAEIINKLKVEFEKFQANPGAEDLKDAPPAPATSSSSSS